GVERVGVVGARFGAMVAALVAERARLPLMALWQPFVSGAEFLLDSLQTAILAQRLDQAEQGGGNGGLQEDLRNMGWSDVNGWLLTQKAWQEISAIDLIADLKGFRGSALTVGVSLTGSPPKDPAAIAAHLRSQGASCAEYGVEDQGALVFGQRQFQKLPDRQGEKDALYEVSTKIADITTRWAIDQLTEDHATSETNA
ncbi:MAG TPA: hypothetical protein VEN82_09190, partial [Actinomycetota bacterium]|nr:hypothetical protein [Actinomycetota bacterium]